MNILITGGAGFIGSNFIYYILEKYPLYNVICLDKLTYAGKLITLNKAQRNQNFKFLKGDIANRNFVYKIFNKYNFDLVVNFAAESHVDRSIENPELFLTTNVIGTQILMDSCIKYDVNRFHQVSTDEVYGDLPLDRPDLLFNENSKIITSSPYSSSKAAADLLVYSYYRTFGLNITISRCSNNYGPFQHPEKLIPKIIDNTLKNIKIPVYGDGKNVRDWLHVYDHCSAIDLIIHKGKIGEVYNIGGNNELSNIVVVKKILDYMGKSYELISYVEDRKGHDLRYGIDPRKISKELGWKPNFKFDEGIKKTIDWYINNQVWISKVKESKS